MVGPHSVKSCKSVITLEFGLQVFGVNHGPMGGWRASCSRNSRVQMTKASSAVQGANAAPVRFRKVGSAEPSFTATIKETQLQEAEL